MVNWVLHIFLCSLSFGFNCIGIDESNSKVGFASFCFVFCFFFFKFIFILAFLNCSGNDE